MGRELSSFLRCFLWGAEDGELRTAIIDTRFRVLWFCIDLGLRVLQGRRVVQESSTLSLALFRPQVSKPKTEFLKSEI